MAMAFAAPDYQYLRYDAAQANYRVSSWDVAELRWHPVVPTDIANLVRFIYGKGKS